MATKDAAVTVRERIRTAALGLFALHGVNGTSLQMIADEIGVTKAAVYYHFPSKHDLVDAIITPYIQQYGPMVEAAERKRRHSQRAEAILTSIVEMLVCNRLLNAALLADPVIVRVLRTRPDMQDLDRRTTALLTGPDPDPQTFAAAVMIRGGLALAPLDPYLARLDDDALRRHLLAAARHLLRLRPPAAARAVVEPHHDTHQAVVAARGTADGA